MAGTMSVSGLISGLKTGEIISKIMEYARQPQDRLKSQKAEAQSRLAAWQDLNTRMLALKVKSEAIADAADFGVVKVTSSNEDIVTATGSADASPGSYYLKIIQRAQAHQVSSQAGAYTSANDVVGTGTVTINLNDASSFAVTLTSNNNTLAGLRDAVNDADKGVTASIINAGTSSSPDYRLLLTSDSTGEDAGMSSVVVSLTGGTAPSFNLVNPVQAALNAQIEIGGGTGGTAIQIEKATNTITDVIPGVTLNILGSDASETIRLDVTRDVAAVKTAITDFVAQYNSLASQIKALTDYDTDTQETGLLLGDFQLRSVQMDIESAVTGAVAGVAQRFSALSTVGITTDVTGQLVVDNEELTDALEDNISSVVKLFDSNLETESSYISYIASTSDTEPSAEAGYMVQITQAARRAQVTAGAEMADPLDLDESLIINGTTIALSSGMTLDDVIATVNSYSGTTNVAALKTGADGTGDGNYLTLRAVQHGSTRTVSAMSTYSRSAGHTTGLGNVLVVPSSPGGEGGLGQGLVGLDVAGTINGEAATGSGQVLSLASSTSENDAKGLALLITATAAMDPVAVHFTKGIGARVRDLLGQMTSTGGAILNAQDGVNGEIQDLDDGVTRMEELLTDQEARLYSQFNAMEARLAELQSQGNYLTAMLSSTSSSSSK